MTTYPIEFHRRLEQKWAGRIEQILTVTGTAPRHEIPPTTMIRMRTRGRSGRQPALADGPRIMSTRSSATNPSLLWGPRP